MKKGADRRIHHRWDSEDTIYGYVDGARFDASPENISSGGMFLETKDLVPVGALVSLVFRDQAKSTEPPIFLIGRVMRRQTTWPAGLGLRWEKAIFAGPAAVLQRFIEGRLQLESPEVTSITGAEGEPQATHYFSSLPPQPAAYTGGVPSSAGRAPDTTPDSGPVTTRINRQHNTAPANVRSMISVDEKSASILVHSLGLMRMVTSWPDDIDVAPDVEVTVTLSVHTRVGIVAIPCACIVVLANRAREDSEGTLVLDLVGVEEPRGHKGLLSRYVRWLHFNALTN